jgi:DNA-binding response OmpR family regulator
MAMTIESYGRLKLLFVDDAAHTRLMLREMLRTTKWPQAEFADSAASAFQQIRANVPDLVITDWQMPGESGLDLIRMIRQHRDSPDRLLPVILLTANGDAQHVIGARKAGAIDFLVKPVSMKRIVERVINAVTRPRSFIVSASYVGPDWRRPAGQPMDPKARPEEPLPAGAVVLPPDGLLLAKVRGDPAEIRDALERRAAASATVAAALRVVPRAGGHATAAGNLRAATVGMPG